MKLIIKRWGDTDNPRNYPADYPADSTTIGDKDPIPRGWVEISKEAYQKAIEDNVEAVKAINIQFEEAEKAAAEQVKEETKADIEVLQEHVDMLDQGAADNNDRLAAADTTARLLVKFAPVLEQLLESLNKESR